MARECEAPHPELAWARLPRPLRELSLREMIGQLLVVSYSGTKPTSKGVETARLALRRSEIGGVLTFRHNIASADDIRAINRLFADAHTLLPALVAVDQEGGAVMRVKPSEGGPATPSARDVAKGSLDEAAEAYAAMAKTLADLGFTANFGPVVDLEVNPANPVIARFGRAYSASVDVVVRYAKTFIDAHMDAGVATAVKHFPGHGSSTEDSHDRAIDLTATWSRQELLPFQQLIERDLVDMVMVGHLELDGVSGPGELPASLSPIAINGLLRETLCFGGVVVSDDLAMDAVESRWGSPEAARLMIEAGGDIALVSLPAGKGMELVREITEHLVAQAEQSEEFADKIRQAFARVVNHKLDVSELPAGPSALSNFAGLAVDPADPRAH
ncbi:MAG: glycoside hydrolase family 3 N-terminal domain-containing protein [Pseudomonadota bacterium]